MSDVFVSYARADQELVRRVVALLEARGWSVWWDTRIVGGERWDKVIEREITAARCVVVVWTPQSFDREWVHLEAHHGRKRKILVPVLAGVDEPPFAFSLIQARNLTGWDGASKTTVVSQFVADVRQKLEGGSAQAAPRPEPLVGPPASSGSGTEAEPETPLAEKNAGKAGRFRRAPPTVLRVLGEHPTEGGTLQILSGRYGPYVKHGAVSTTLPRGKAPEKLTVEEAVQLIAERIAKRRYRAEGLIKVDASIIHGAPDGWFRPGAGKTEWFKDLDVGPEMVVVPVGEFVMGSNDGEENLPYRLTIKAPFAVGRFATTFAEWDAAGLAYKPSDMGWGRGRRPVITVSWDDAQAYVSWLSQRTGKVYRLPSEAEWEYCCRAATNTRTAFGETMTKQQAQCSERTWGDAKQTIEVGTFPPNAWGLYDMHGNVWEWCAGGDASHRAMRGESWFNLPVNFRSDARFRLPPTERSYDIGFRVARTLSHRGHPGAAIARP